MQYKEFNYYSLSLCVCKSTSAVQTSLDVYVRWESESTTATIHWAEYINIIIFYYYYHWWWARAFVRACKSKRAHTVFYSHWLSNVQWRKARFWINCRWKFAFQVIVILYSLSHALCFSRSHFHELVQEFANVDLWNISTRLMQCIYKVTGTI